MNEYMSGAVQRSNIERKLRDRDYFEDISGAGTGGHTKAHVVLRYYHKYMDGTFDDLEVLSFDKPIVRVFKHAGFVNVFLDFGRREDIDLRMSWRLLEDYSSPTNSVDYLPEEIESGYYEDDLGRHKVYIPLIELVLSPIGKEDKYEMQGYNPIFFSLAPSSPDYPDPCVLQLTFMDTNFTVYNMLKELDIHELENEVMMEIAEEMNRQTR